jgi:predicted RNA binding protein YcfA (HicA-like mRNA interferase family)
MSQHVKRVCRILNNPRDVRFADIRNILEGEGYRLENIRGSHFVYTNGTVIITVVKRKKIAHPVSVDRVIETLELRERYGDQCE